MPGMAQEKQPSIYKVTKLSFNSGSFNDIAPVIIKDGIMFCSDKRFSGFRDRTSFEGRRIYNIYIVARKDSSKWGKLNELKSERTDLFNNGPLCLEFHMIILPAE